MSDSCLLDYQSILDDESRELLRLSDALADRVRVLGEATIRSAGQISRTQRIVDNDSFSVDEQDMIDELISDNRHLEEEMWAAIGNARDYGDVTTPLISEPWFRAHQRMVPRPWRS
jgi:starvation-inducible DNA-binding protein